MVIFKLLYLSYMPTTLYFSYFQTNSIAMLYLVHKYKKKFESINMDLTHSKIMTFSSFSILLYIVEAKKGCKKKSLNILSLAAYLLKCF